MYNRIEHLVHLRYAGVRLAQHTNTCTCLLHKESGLTTHTDITSPHLCRPCSKPHTLSPSTPPIQPQPKHRHTSNTPLFVKPKPNPLFHSPSSPTTPLRAKRIYILHTPPTPLIPRTTLTSSMSAALDTMPEPCVPPTYSCPVLTTTTHTQSHQHYRHPFTLSQHTHLQHRQQYTHHSHRTHIGY